MLTKKFNKATYDHERMPGLTNNEPSMTIPGQSTELAILIQRQANNQQVRQFKPEWEGATTFDQAFPDFSRMDRADRAAALLDVQKNVDQIRWKLDAEAKERVIQERIKLSEEQASEATNANAQDPK